MVVAMVVLLKRKPSSVRVVNLSINPKKRGPKNTLEASAANAVFFR